MGSGLVSKSRKRFNAFWVSKGSRLGLLTGTFDPVHLGHVALAEAAIREYALGRVLIWVNASAGHKVGVTAYQDRLAMMRLAVRGHDKLDVYEGGLSDRPQVSKWFRELEREFPADELVYIVGADTLMTLDRWEDVESVVDNSTFAVAERGEGTAGLLEELRSRLGPLGQSLRASVFSFEEYGEASSSKVRVQVRAGGRPSALDERVYEYVLSRNLYR